MPRRRNGRRRQVRNVPQKSNNIIDFTKFQPTRKIKIATETTVSVSNPVQILQFGNNDPPGNAITNALTFLQTFYTSRVVSIDVFFDQRGAASTAAIPRATAWVVPSTSAALDAAKIVQIARFAGSGLNQVMPGRCFKIRLGPRFIRDGQFVPNDEVGTFKSSLILATKDYNGTIRIHTTFETVGPPIDYEVASAGATDSAIGSISDLHSVGTTVFPALASLAAGK